MSAPESEPRRLTPTERLHEVTMAFAQRTPAPPEHSVSLTRNAKGIVQIDVTVRGFDLSEVVTRARETFSSLDTELPYPEDAS